MVIIPFERAIDWRRPPVVTLLLVLINVFVFFTVQRDDDTAMERAIDFYLESTLPAIEFPVYLSALEQRGDGNLKKMRALSETEGAYFLMVMETDEPFMAHLRANRVITPEDERFREWRMARTEFERHMAASTPNTFGFTPARHRPVTFLTHMFLHGGLGHLMGNMVFLVLVGLAVERVLGSALYLVFYLVGGLGAVGLFLLVYPDSTTPLIGASGAIAAVMGLYAVLFGRRRIRFFYSLLFYFDYIKAPAYIMLFLWLGNEFYQLFWGGASNVAYVAHIGGLLAGALLGFGAKALPRGVNLDFLDAREDADARQYEFARGLGLMSELQMAKACTVFKALHQKHPEDQEVLAQFYKAARFQPGSEDHHYAAGLLLAVERSARSSPAQIHETLCDYLSTTHGKVRLAAPQLLVLATRFAKAGYAETSERILFALMKRQPAMPGLHDALGVLAEAWRRRGDEARYTFCLRLQRPASQIAVPNS